MKILTLLSLVLVALLCLARPIAFTARALTDHFTIAGAINRLSASTITAWQRGQLYARVFTERLVLSETGGVAMQMLTGFTTQPNTGAAWTMATGDSLTIRAGLADRGVWLLNMWGDNQVAGRIRITSPQLHDNVEGIQQQVAISTVRPLLPMGFPQRLYPQDTLVVNQSGSNVAGDIESGSLLVLYDDLPGANARFIDGAELQRRLVEYMVVTNGITTGAGGGYTGEETIIAEDDQWKANQDYALVGYVPSVECCSIGWRGTDTSNYRVGGPGCEDAAQLTASWFLLLSQAFNRPLIPVFNAANKGNILIDAVQDENAAAVTVSSIFARLAPVGGIVR